MKQFGKRTSELDNNVVTEETKPRRHLVHESDAAPQLAAEALDDHIGDTKTKVFSILIESVDLAALNRLPPETAKQEISEIVFEVLTEINAPLSNSEQTKLVEDVVNDAFGLGPLEELLRDDSISDILVNSPNSVYIERDGRLKLTDVKFRDTAQLMNICVRVASAVGRRIDEASPICDTRLSDGSRVNIIIPPLSVKAPMLTIRKFRKSSITLDDMVNFGSITEEAANFLSVAVASRANILISGGTGSGKTTLLNAMSEKINVEERIITVEDTAELKLLQPHVGQLETRPPNTEGKGQITQRDLVKNCLRMRPDRIIVGEVRGGEAFDMLQAMNTGHEGSMSTVHANTPAESLIRLGDMVALTGFQLPSRSVQMQIASALDLIVQIERMQDGGRRVVNITDVADFHDDGVVLHDLFVFYYEGIDNEGQVLGELKAKARRAVKDGKWPTALRKAEKHGLRNEMLKSLGLDPSKAQLR